MSSHDNLAICLPQQEQKEINQTIGQRIDGEIRGWGAAAIRGKKQERMVTLDGEITRIKSECQPLQLLRKTKGMQREGTTDRGQTELPETNTARWWIYSFYSSYNNTVMYLCSSMKLLRG